MMTFLTQVIRRTSGSGYWRPHPMQRNSDKLKEGQRTFPLSRISMFQISKKRIGAYFCLSVLMLIGNVPSSIGQTLEAHPRFDLGDKWTFSFQNIGDRKEPYTYTEQVFKIAEDSGWLYVETQEPNAKRPQSVVRYDLKRADVIERFNLNPVEPKNPGGKFNTQEQEGDLIQLPLMVGKEYKLKINRPDRDTSTEYDVKVGPMEKVKTQAGEFDVYRVSAKGWWRRGSHRGRADNTIYFAPSVKRIIKSEYFDRLEDGRQWNATVVELVKWEPKAALAPAFANPVAPNGDTVPASELKNLGNLDRYAGGTVDLSRGEKGVVYALRRGCVKEAPSYESAMNAIKETGFLLPIEVGVLYDAGVGTRRSASCGGDVGVRAIGIQLASEFVGQHKIKFFSDQVTIQVVP
jgi:hypothetical protein